MVNSTQENLYNKVDFRLPIKNDFVSVIIPVYKDAQGLHDTLTSLQNQTLEKSRFEIIVANDGDDLQVSNVCKKFNIKEVKIIPNKGSYNARNKALEESKGEFFAFTDADVIVPEDWLINGLLQLQKYDYIGGPICFNEKKKLTVEEKFAQKYEFNIQDSFDREHFFVTANLFTKRKVVEELGGFDIRLHSGGDTEFGNRIHSSKQFRQQFYVDLSVIHPYRNYLEIINKKKRITKGLAKLIEYYPERFKHLKSSYFDEFRSMLTPPLHELGNLKFFFFIWKLNIIVSLYKIKYIKTMRVFLENSRVYKLINFASSK